MKRNRTEHLELVRSVSGWWPQICGNACDVGSPARKLREEGPVAVWICINKFIITFYFIVCSYVLFDFTPAARLNGFTPLVVIASHGGGGGSHPYFLSLSQPLHSVDPVRSWRLFVLLPCIRAFILVSLSVHVPLYHRFRVEETYFHFEVTKLTQIHFL